MSEHTEDVERLVLSSLDVTAGREAALRELFPEAFTDNRFDPSKIEPHLSVASDESPGPERYGLSWAGKADAMRAVQVLSTGTLHPDRAESVEFDSTPDVMIEGDNLEVLKLLQRSYYGDIKMIYIDPPYNTGQDFIYPDNYREGLETYLRFTGQTDEEGFRTTANAETGGRYHSRWLSMMYPRLVLARNSRRRAVRHHRRSRSPQLPPAARRGLWAGELCGVNYLAEGVLAEEHRPSLLRRS
ncbi:MAG: hypothetical protein WED83_00805 [Acidimicrobiia bacterium]